MKIVSPEKMYLNTFAKMMKIRPPTIKVEKIAFCN